MNDMTPGIGHNAPPDPIELVCTEFSSTLDEAQNWADGEPVENEAGMKAVDAVLKEFKTYKTALVKAGKERTDPLHKTWKAEVAAVKVYTDDADRLQSALVATVGPFKQKLAAEKAEAERKAWEETNRLRRDAEAKAAAANAADIDAQREAAAAKQAVIDAENAAKAIAKDAPKGMRKTTHHEVTDMRALVNWIATNDKDAMADFATEYARKNHKTTEMTGVRVWETKEAY